jgi:SAM-dependent methyltransferase
MRAIPYLAYSVRRRGIFGTCRVLLRGAVEYFPTPQPRSEFDRRAGLDTDGVLSLRRFSIDSPNEFEGVRYEGCSASDLRAALKSLTIDLSKFVFVDLGAGKGRALAVAAEFPFRRLKGIEFAPELVAIGRRNLQKIGLDARAEIVLRDAADYEFENTPTILFLYNPFRATVMAKVVEQISRLTAPLLVVYQHPVCATLLADFEVCGRFHEVLVFRRKHAGAIP